MRRVLIVSHTYIEPSTRGKLRALAARGLELTVAVPQHWQEAAFGRTITTTWERRDALEIFPIPVSHPGDAVQSRFGRRALRALLRDKRPDLVQIEEEPGTEFAQQVVGVAGRHKIPAVLCTQDNSAGRGGWMARWQRRRLLRRLSGVVAAGLGAAARVRREAPDVPLVVAPQLGAPVPPAPAHVAHEGLTIGFIGRLVPPKGLDTLLQALARLRADAWRLIVVGDGPAREALEKLATELRLAARIRWTGALPPDQMPQIWPQLDVVVMPSKPTGPWSEPAGHPLVEAMAHEIAVVGTETGVIPEVIGEAGLVVAPGNPDALAEALQRLSDGPTRGSLAQAARARAMQQFSDDAVAERTMRFWESIVVS